MTASEDRGRIVSLAFGAMAAQVLYVAARLGVADRFGEAERSGAELAGALGAEEASITRLLRAMAALGLASETAPGRFRLTGAGALLASDRPDSMHAFTQMFGDPTMLAAWRELEHAVRTGETTFDRVYGKDFFAYLAENPAMSAQFNAAMHQGTAAIAALLPGHYDFSRFATVADIGGGDGTLLAAVLAANPGLRGILFDTAEGLAQADATLAAVRERCTAVPGDFFHTAPDGAELYLLKSVIHDWDDERCTTILGHIRAVLPEQGRLLIIEPVLPDVVDGTLPPQMYLSDLNMLVNVGGRERTRADFETLCSRSRFRVAAITALPAPAGYCLIEAAPA